MPSRNSARDTPRSDTSLALDSLRRIVRALRVAASGAESSTGLTSSQLFVLQVVHVEPGCSLTEVAARTMTDRTSVAAVVDRLVAKGLVERRRATHDLRRVELRPTERASDVLADAPHAPTRRVLEALGALDERERRRLAQALASLVRAMGLEADPASMLFDEMSTARTRGKREAQRRRPA